MTKRKKTKGCGKRPRNQLKRKDQIELETWYKDKYPELLEKKLSYAEAADMATAAKGFLVTVGNIQGVSDTFNKPLAASLARKQAKEARAAAEQAAIAATNGNPPPALSLEARVRALEQGFRFLIEEVIPPLTARTLATETSLAQLMRDLGHELDQPLAKNMELYSDPGKPNST